MWFYVRGSVRESVLASLVLLALSACAGDESPDPGPYGVDVPVRHIYDMSQGAYFEGSYSYVRVENLDGDELMEKRFPQEGRTQRPCSGDCGHLDPPTDECSREIVVRPRAGLLPPSTWAHSPKRRSRCWNVRTARRKSSSRNAGQ
jgi:hypothetical protein